MNRSLACRGKDTGTLRRLATGGLPAVVLLVCLAPAITVAAGFDAEVAYTADDNVTRGPSAPDKLKDRFLGVTAAANWLQLTGDNTRIAYRAFLRAEIYGDFEKLNNTGLGASATFQYRASSAFLEPTYSAFLRATSLNYDSALRSGMTVNLGVSASKPLTDRITVLGILARNQRETDSEIFSTRETSLLANLDYQLTRRSTLFLTLNYLDGDVVSTYWYTGTWPAWAYVWDDAFGGSWYAYKLSAQTQVFTLGANIGLGENSAIDLSARRAVSSTGCCEYTRNLVSLAYLQRF